MSFVMTPLLEGVPEAQSSIATAPKSKKNLTSEERAHLLLEIIEDRKAVEPVVLDLRDRTLVADFFMICSGTSNVHIRAIADAVIERVDMGDLPKPRTEGREVGEWVLLDFSDVVLHVMSEEARARYRLEQFWTTAQPKGALFPTPGNTLDQDDEIDDEDFDADEDLEFDEDEIDDAAFFEEADEEVEPLDEEDEDDLDEPIEPGSTDVAPKNAEKE